MLRLEDAPAPTVLGLQKADSGDPTLQPVFRPTVRYGGIWSSVWGCKNRAPHLRYFGGQGRGVGLREPRKTSLLLLPVGDLCTPNKKASQGEFT